MVVQLFTSVVYSIVESSWIFATVFTKYFLIIGMFKVARKGENYLEDFQSFLLNYSREFIIAVIAVGSASAVLNYSFTPISGLFSSLVTVSYLGFLFWKF